jgi:hypothetical protein
MLKGRANSGTLVLLRSIYVAAIFFLFAVGLDSMLSYSARVSFDRGVFSRSVREHLPWYGAALGGVYAALYARFSSQWQYLAGLYNQLMAAEDARPRVLLVGEHRKRRMLWWHAFIVDAQDLHLALKPSFAGAVSSLLEEPEILELMGGDTAREKDDFQAFRRQVHRVSLPNGRAPKGVDARV